MAAWSTGGAMSLRIVNMDLCRTRYATLETQNGAKSVQKRSLCSLRAIQRKKEAMQFSGAAVRLGRLSRCVPMACESTSQTAENPSDSKEEKKSGRGAALFTPNSLQVESLVTEICDTTSIAEFKLDFGGFRLYLKRGLGELSAIPQPAQLPPPPPPATVPAVQRDTTETSTSNGLPKTTTSLALLKSKPSSTGVQRFLDSASDQGLAILQSPKVGFFRRSRTVKGKRAPPSCQEKQVVKEGQVLCYIEQLGGEIPIESDVSGEVIKILREDGEPVGYGDALITVLPSFPGIKKLQQ